MKIYNRKFSRNYQEIEKYEAGVVLNGAEVKSICQGRIKLEDAYVKILGDEVYLINAQIPLYQFAQNINYNPSRMRKLLLHKNEIIRLKTKIVSNPGLTIVPVSCYNKKNNLIKLEIALTRGRKNIEKRRLEKKRAIEREKEREAKEYMKS